MCQTSFMVIIVQNFDSSKLTSGFENDLAKIGFKDNCSKDDLN